MLRLFESSPWNQWKHLWRIRQNRIMFTISIGLIFFVLVGIPYHIANQINSYREWIAFDPMLNIDAITPYIPILNLGYFSFYLYYVLIPFFAREEIQRKLAIVFTQRLVVATLPVFVLFILFPVQVDMRDSIQGDDLLTTLLSLIHSIDEPYNAWPSLHIVHSLCVVLAVPLVFKISKLNHTLLWIAWLILGYSTMTTQQHYLFDIITGIIYALIIHFSLIKPVIKRTIQGEFDERFQSFQANNEDTTSG
ncbi:MAG: hypothetical protein CMA97_01070 [Euryarchaeota archaeon]|nr:hypothetical protein [Euryarchaeota archaeon]